MATKDQIVKLIAVMSLAYPKFVIKDGAPDLYFQMLKDIDYIYLDEAVKRIVASSVFFPSIAEWRKTAIDLMPEKAGIPSEFEAWEEVMQKIGSLWKHEEPEWSHHLITRAVKAIGFDRLCYFNLDDLAYERNNFYKAYNTFKERAEIDILMLPGREPKAHELNNRINQLTKQLTDAGERKIE